MSHIFLNENSPNLCTNNFCFLNFKIYFILCTFLAMNFQKYLKKITHGSENLTTLLVKYFNDLLGDQSSERSRDEVTFFYVGDVLCIHLGTTYANFQEKTTPETSGKSYKVFIVVMLLQ